MRRARGVFVCGTDTGVGKTIVTAALGLGLEALGEGPVAVMKPVETGCRFAEGRLVPRDARLHRRMLRLSEDDDGLCPVRLSHPVAPFTAAELEGRSIRRSDWYPSFQRLMKRYRFLLVEGAGGAMVPVSERTLVSDFPRIMRIPCVVVARTGLGTINHTLLTVEHLRRKGVHLLGLVFNEGSAGTGRGIAERTGPSLAARLAKVPVIGTLPRIPSIRRDALAELGRIPAGRLVAFLEQGS